MTATVRPASMQTGTSVSIIAPWFISATIGIVGTWTLFPWPVLAGTAPFWIYPRGVFEGSWGDMATALSGYDAFVRDAWRWPLFQAAGLGEHGIDIIFTDSIPIVALLGRLLFRITGQVVPLFGAWAGLCILGMALASTGLVRTLGARSLSAAAAAAAIGVSMPALLGRWGHLSLMAQAFVPLALICYGRLTATLRPVPWRVLAQAVALCAAAVMVSPYLFLMVAGLTAAAILQAGTDRRLTRPAALAILAALTAILWTVMEAMGFWSVGEAAAADGYGFYSMNLLSPVVPSDGWHWRGFDVVANASGGQYEGSIFLGAGLIGALLLCRAQLAAILKAGTRRHVWLLLTVIAFTCFAITNQVCAGPNLLLSIPLPDFVVRAAGTFRSSGRFAWVGLYLVAALAVVAVERRRWGGLILLTLAGLQWAQAEPLRDLVRASVAGPAAPIIDRAAWTALMPDIDRLIVDPPYACLTKGPVGSRLMWAAVELQLLASRSGVPTNTVYAGRISRDCLIPPATARSVIVYLGAAPPDAPLSCRTGELITICGSLPIDAPSSLTEVGQINSR